MNHSPKTMYTRWLLLLLFCLPAAARAQNNMGSYRPLFQTNPYLKQWAATIAGFRLSAFKYSGTVDFENMLINDSLPQPDNSFNQTFGKLLSYSPNKKKYLDFYSGQLVFDTLLSNGKKIITVSADIDQYLFLGDYTARKVSRILFMGATNALEEAIWISDHDFILTGTTRNDHDFSPFMYIGDVEKRQLRRYLPDNKNIKRDTLYRSPRWKNIRGLNVRDL
ncbi:hypothetical protein ACTJJ0_25600 [Chitinophaga sp. 22321]|uniref:DUF5117 domain-containing protein n=1 Tax=Chitinophaga hostae TaxID=2831022 RepID=A0ABS5J7A0_9BACT|nr:hypothetical protein [Chitinophaga hostae]MBS0030437.1 hypothetical protein [Chitinophaga hostae]